MTVREAAYADRPLADVRAALKALGLRTTVADTRRDNPGGHQPGSVAALAPDGKVRTGTLVTLTLWGAEPSPAPAPKKDSDKGKGNSNGKGADHGKPKGKKKRCCKTLSTESSARSHALRRAAARCSSVSSGAGGRTTRCSSR